MIPAYLSPLANHLWQSTLFALIAALLTLAFRRHRAAVRYGIWLAASVKFLLPFAMLVSLGAQFEWRGASTSEPSGVPAAIEQIGEPFLVVSPAALPNAPAPPAPTQVPSILFAVWLAGFCWHTAGWFRRWRSVHTTLRTATPLPLDLPIPTLSTRARMEPGVFGILHPVLLLPEGITARLTAAQLDSIVAHELCHVRRRDNLAAAIHMAVESLFWFHPLVWWLEARLVEERERACDEAVLAASSDPEVYAESILTVCKVCLGSPLVCVSGVTGADLKRRIEAIMAPRVARQMDGVRKLLLAAAGVAALALPIAIGLANAGRIHAQAEPALAFEVASVKLNNSGSQRAPSQILPGGRFTATNNTVRSLILNAYGISGSHPLLTGGPAWIDSEAYDIEAKAEAGAIPAGTPSRVLWEKTRLMLQTLLADRFHLVIRRETKEQPVFEITVAKNGPKLQKSDLDCTRDQTACHGFAGNPTRLGGTGVDMPDLAGMLSKFTDRPVLDKTGIPGFFDIKLQWNPFAGQPQPADGNLRSPLADHREGRNPDLESQPDLPTALDQQLGLKLESRKGPVSSFVIVSVEHPSTNQDVDKPVLAFHVASVKANHSGREGTDGFDVSHGALTVRNVSLKMLVEAAYRVQGVRIAGGPDWLNRDRFDVVAKGPSGATRQQVWTMLQGLLADRFQFRFQRDTKELPIYALEVAKNGPKLDKVQDADCEDGEQPFLSQGVFTPPCGGVARMFGPRGGYMAGRRVPMAGVADALSDFVERPVFDRTALPGAYHIELRWTPDDYKPAVQSERISSSSERRGRPVEPFEPGPSIFAAVQEQLGLKLVSTKAPVEILVVKRAEKPSEN